MLVLFINFILSDGIESIISLLVYFSFLNLFIFFFLMHALKPPTLPQPSNPPTFPQPSNPPTVPQPSAPPTVSPTTQQPTGLCSANPGPGMFVCVLNCVYYFCSLLLLTITLHLLVYDGSSLADFTVDGGADDPWSIDSSGGCDGTSSQISAGAGGNGVDTNSFLRIDIPSGATSVSFFYTNTGLGNNDDFTISGVGGGPENLKGESSYSLCCIISQTFAHNMLSITSSLQNQRVCVEKHVFLLILLQHS